MNVCKNDIDIADNIYCIKLVVTDKLTDKEKEKNYNINLKSSINDTENFVLPATYQEYNAKRKLSEDRLIKSIIQSRRTVDFINTF